MYNRNDPRFRRTINQITHNLESANEATQVGLFSFTEHYIKPCFSSVAASFEPCTAVCFPRREDRLRRQRARSRGRPEYNFDFYDDWENDENDALLSLGNEEFDRIVGGNTSQETANQPSLQGGMNYGSRGELRYSSARRRSAGAFDVGADPTIIPNQSRFGFLNKLPFKIGGKGLRYQPSAADLQERPMAKDRRSMAHDALDEDANEEEASRWRVRGRKRSATTGSGHTTDSLSSRGDLFISDDEEDAVPLDDEFAMVLDRRNTFDDSSSGKTKDSSRPAGTRHSTRTVSSKSVRKSRLKSSHSSTPKSRASETPTADMPTMLDLKLEEQRLQAEEEEVIERKRQAAQRLALEKGLTWADGEPKLPPTNPTSTYDLNPAVPAEQFITDSTAGFPFPKIEELADQSGAPAQGEVQDNATNPAMTLHGSAIGSPRQSSIAVTPQAIQPTNDT